MWCLPDVLLTPEICGSPPFMFLLGGEIWLSLLAAQIGVAVYAVGFAVALVSAPFRRRRGR